MNIKKWPVHAVFILSVLVSVPLSALYCQDTSKVLPDGTEGVLFTPYDSAASVKSLKPNEFDGSFSTFRIGLGYIHDFVAYSESRIFRQQMDSAGFNLEPAFQLRDFRILGSGMLKTKRYIAWKFAYMWDAAFDQWLVRESGVTIGLPELSGHIFIGRTKEGFSMVKVMNGHSPWTAERQMALDVVPILADGIKFFGHLPRQRIFWNIGAYNDLVSEGQGFSTFAWQYAARIGWMPFYKKQKSEVLHIAANLRYGKPLNGELTLKSRPESNPTPQILNTGKLSANYTSHIGGEIYYSKKSFIVGSEIVFHNLYSNNSDNHQFYGGDVVVGYLFTRAVRPYNTVGNVYGFVPVKKSVFKGGWGEWEAVLRFSMLNLDDRSVKGGRFWRITPMINWYISRILRMEFVYGYGELDRYGLKGGVQFFQSRIQFTVM